MFTRRSESWKCALFSSVRSNELAWNPMEAFVFAVGSEDYNTYAFDLR